MNSVFAPKLLPTIASTPARTISPLSGDGLLEPGAEFPRAEIHRRVLSHCWRDCCLPECFSRSPAPVIEFAEPDRRNGVPRHRIAAWWLLSTGIVVEDEGPHSERLRPYVGGIGRNGQSWPRYEFFLSLAPGKPPERTQLTAEIAMFPKPLVSTRQRISFEHDHTGRLRVVARDFLYLR